MTLPSPPPKNLISIVNLQKCRGSGHCNVMHIGLMQFVVQHIEFQVFMSNHFISFFSNNIFFGKLSSWVKLSVVDFPETAVKGVFKFLSLTIGRYEDNRSRQAVKNLVRELAKVHPTATLKNVSSALSSEAEAQRKRVHARYGKEYFYFKSSLHELSTFVKFIHCYIFIILQSQFIWQCFVCLNLDMYCIERSLDNG